MKTIYIHSEKYGTKEILVDDEDFDFANQWKWHVNYCSGKFYAIRTSYMGANNTPKYRCFKLHREILKITDPKILIDHRDGNPLNNQKNNLRFCTHAQNMKNRKSKKNGTSRFLGVSFQIYKNRYIKKDGSKTNRTSSNFVSAIQVDGKPISLGSFPPTRCGELCAALAYDIAAEKYHGEFAKLNFL